MRPPLAPLKPLQVLSLLALIVVTTGCAQRRPMLYDWGPYPRQQYEVLARKGAVPEDQIRAMEEHAQSVGASARSLPPGFRAHLGFLYMQVGNVDRARAAWNEEKLLFPESATYLDQLLKRLDGKQAPSTVEQGA